jgi:hypothetical protein
VLASPSCNQWIRDRCRAIVLSSEAKPSTLFFSWHLSNHISQISTPRYDYATKKEGNLFAARTNLLTVSVSEI